MTQNSRHFRTWRLSLPLLGAAVATGWYTEAWSVAGLLAVVAIALPVVNRSRASVRRRTESARRAPPAGADAGAKKPATGSTRAASNAAPSASADPTQLADRLIEAGRTALLLRPQIARGLETEQLVRAIEAFDSAMSIVPAGHVLLESWRDDDAVEDGTPRTRLVQVDALYLDRYPVTNAAFQRFVDDDGYARMALWEPNIWPAVLDFVDRTGAPGPRFWEHGCCPDGQGDHPVVGVSWYEAAAFARWSGKRLPSDPEWVKATCWPVATEGPRPIQRRYPWGNTMDRERVNIWGSGPDGTVGVGEFSAGVSVGGAYQLIGNVWEWTTSDFGVWDATARRLELATPMKSIRGGAFDTYFETQATSQFQSGECPVHRKRNIGFRCALSICDVVSLEESVSEAQPAVAVAGVAVDEEAE